ncbi:hypothetical protein GCM10010174_00980 [Kutzneria viridogrisea]|uniref:NYN domain-containing protein n=1 Tax=Kutzneria viridogrisea TaxID=47990 RepID=A0ABR6BCN4_9PSEU|nr:hypothetical protein [Kutzneria viridogrisea]
MRIGVFYDGTWFAHVSEYFATAHPQGSPIALEGLHDALRWRAHTSSGQPLADCQVSEAHYVRGRRAAPSPAFDAVLANAGVLRHDLELYHGREKGVDVYLALEAWDRATTAPLDQVVLITGDADFVPLVRRLTGRGIAVLVPVVDTHPGALAADRAQLRTAPLLQSTASDAPSWHELFAPCETVGYPLRSPWLGGAPGQRWRGTVTGWRPGQTHGFITDTEGGSWYVSREDIPRGFDALPLNARVSFAGSPIPSPGRDYPRAHSIRFG